MYISKVREGVSESSVDNLSFFKGNLEIVTALESANVVIMHALVILRKSYAPLRNGKLSAECSETPHQGRL